MKSLNNTLYASWYNNNLVTTSTFTSNNKVILNSLYSTSNNRNVYLNAYWSGTDTPGVTHTQASNPNYIGTTPANEMMSGNIYEIIVYEVNHSIKQRQAMEGYLAWKWGIQATLPTTHPFYSAERV